MEVVKGLNFFIVAHILGCCLRKAFALVASYASVGTEEGSSIGVYPGSSQNGLKTNDIGFVDRQAKQLYAYLSGCI